MSDAARPILIAMAVLILVALGVISFRQGRSAPPAEQKTAPAATPAPTRPEPTAKSDTPPTKTGPELERMLGDKDPAVRQQAVAGLVRLKHRALPTLSVVLEGKEKTAVLCALKVVNQLGPTASPVASIISRQVMHADAEVRIEAVRSLVRIGPDGRSALRNGMFSPHVDVRKLVVQLIAKRATEEVELLAATLDDSDAEVRRLAIAGLVSAGQTALPELLQRIQLLDRRPGTYAATRAIHELEKRLLPPHEKQLGDLMLLLLQQGPVAARQVALELALALDRRTEARKILRQVSKNPRDPRAQVWARKRLGD